MAWMEYFLIKLFSYHHTTTGSNDYKLYKFLPPEILDRKYFLQRIINDLNNLPKELSNQIMYGLLNVNLIYMLCAKYGFCAMHGLCCAK